jgi:hypothetical protein
MSDGPLPYKRDVANQLLRKGSLFIHLDPRVNDVVVPPWLRHQAQLVLQVGLDMPIPIPVRLQRPVERHLCVGR